MKICFKHIRKKLAVIGLTTLASLSLTGCGEDLFAFATGNLTNEIDNRFSKNIDIVNQLYQVSLISEKDKEAWIKHIEGVRNSTLKERDVTVYEDQDGDGTAETPVNKSVRCTDLTFDGDGNIHGTTYRAFSRYCVYEDVDNYLAQVGLYSGDDKYDEYTKIISDQGGLTAYSLGDYLDSSKAFGTNNGAGEATRTPGNEEVIHIIKEGTAFDENLDFEIRVLNPELSAEKLDELIGILNQPTIDYGKIDSENFFVNATDTNGEKVTFAKLIDLTQDDLIKQSIDNGTQDKINEPGIDLDVYQPLYNSETYAGSIRFYEFNQAEMNKILDFMGIDSTSGINTEKWLIRKKGQTGSNVMYLMQYPVYYVEGFQDYRDSSGNIDKTRAEADVNKSELAVNIKTGNILYTKNGASSVITSNGDPYLTFGNSLKSTEATGLSSFILNGITTVNMKDSMSTSKDATVVIPRIVLRDYLELTYAPSYKTGDSFCKVVVMGRKLRLVNMSAEDVGAFNTKSTGVTRGKLPANIKDQVDAIRKNSGTKTNSTITTTPSTSGSGTITNTSIYKSLNNYIPLATDNQKKMVFDKSKPIAMFVSADGRILEDSPEIMITEIASIDHINMSEVIVRLGDSTEAIEIKTPRNKDDEETADGLYHYVTQDFITTTTSFPGPIVGQTDWKADSQKMSNNAKATDSQIHQQFYGMLVATNLFDNALFSSWLNSPDENASLDWWITYLADNGYAYSLSTGEVEKYLYDNFRYELQQNGIVMLDLEVVKKIQEEMDAEAEADNIQMIRTVFVTMGWALILYACILFISYQFDTTTDLGLRLVNTLTIGNWEPVKDMNDCPYMDTSGLKYVDIKRISVSCLLIVCVGVFLVIFDVYDLVLALIRMLGTLALEINEILTGITS